MIEAIQFRTININDCNNLRILNQQKSSISTYLRTYFAALNDWNHNLALALRITRNVPRKLLHIGN
jgi:hypothetical protein